MQGELDIIKAHVNFAAQNAAACRLPEWRTLPEVPTGLELNPNWEKERETILARLPHNDVSVPYPNKEIYLETHYRLQREEGIAMLRFAVKEYKDDPRTDDTENTNVYTKVFVKGYSMTRQGALCRIQFSTERSGKKIRWTGTRRLRPGTLVALSTARDNFRTICRPAVIADRFIKGGLELSPPEVQLRWAEVEEAVLDSNEELVMIEARRGFFESVRHCLVGLQHVAVTDTPLDKYLVEGSHTDQTPSYVFQNPKMNITPLFHDVSGEDINKHLLWRIYQSYDINDGIPPALAAHTSLDSSQLEAVHRILTKEMAIIQGPPGTGKTFTSVQALRALLETHNSGGYNGEVIVVAAETNHAVDQILTQLLNFSYRFVRLGSRTKDERIKAFNLHNLRRSVKSSRDKDFDDLENSRKESITRFDNIIKEVLPKDLLDPNVLYHHSIITKEQWDSLVDPNWTFHTPSGRPHGAISEWLGDYLVDLSIRCQQDPIFNTEEITEEDDVEAAEFNIDLEDPAFDDGDDQARIRGIWVSIGGQWGGSNPHGYKESSFLFKRELGRPNLWNVEKKFRGAIYEYWRRQLVSRRYDELRALLADYTKTINSLKIHRWVKDVQCIRSMKINIIGCTTTGLCKYRGLLAALKPKTILIEEAAQSPEATITSALYPDVQQLILVGDDQQLVPRTNCPGLSGMPYNLSVSMFERLVRYLQVPFTMLDMQRRMIPSIREILSPFYPSLRDHPVVQDSAHCAPIPGMPVTSYLFHHAWPEGTDNESLSKYNTREAEMVVRFVAYLVMNGVAANKITILTFYRGQRKIIFQIARRILLNIGVLHLKVFTVDSYQGQENDIVLLSLVRSNRQNMPSRVGFVEDMNRGVVSISRARRGFFIFGNITNLENATETSAFMWGSVRQVFERQGLFNPFREGLPICCKNHGTVSYIDGPDTFANNLGGCWEPCRGRFEDCGHACGRFCHPLPHSKLVCQEPCARRLSCGHNCSKVCGVNCKCSRDCRVFSALFPPERSQTHHTYRLNLGGNERGGDNRRVSGARHSNQLASNRDNSQIMVHQDITKIDANIEHNLVPGDEWLEYNAINEDERQRQAIHVPFSLAGTGEQLNQGNEPIVIRDEFRLIKLDSEGKREVDDVLVMSTPSKKMDDTPDKSQSISKSSTLAVANAFDVAPTVMPFGSKTPTFRSTRYQKGGIGRRSRALAVRDSKTHSKDYDASTPTRNSSSSAQAWQQFSRAHLEDSSSGSVKSTPRGDYRGDRARHHHNNIRSQARGYRPSVTLDTHLAAVQEPVDNSGVIPSYRQEQEWEASTTESDEPASSRLQELNAAEPANDGDVEDLIEF